MVFMKILNKNQIFMFTAALSLIAVGYLAYKPIELDSENVISTTVDSVETSNIGEAVLVNSSAIDDYVNKNNEEKETLENEIKNVSNNNDYYTLSKLERDKMYSQMLENYQKIIDNVNVSAEQKSIATTEITKINNTKNAIMIAENLIKTRGIEDVVIFVNGDSVNVVIKAEELTSNRVAQIQNIINRELNTDVTNIHISKK